MKTAKCQAKVEKQINYLCKFLQVEIFWDPPKGDFTKYYLYIDHLSEREAPKPEQYLRLSSAISYESNDTTLVDLVTPSSSTSSCI